MNIPFINLADVRCWMIFLMPFDDTDRDNYAKVNAFQHSCLKNKIFGMGWSFDEMDGLFDAHTVISEEAVNRFSDKLRELYAAYDETLNENSLSTALQNYAKIKIGDYIMTRFKNGHYAIGRVATDITFIFDKNDTCRRHLTWSGYVEEWVEFKNDSELPSELIGRFSSRYNKIIEPNNWYRQNLLIISAYQKRAKRRCDDFMDIPPFQLTVTNFARSCDYKELEDLVAFYIYKRHAQDGYYLLPSTCKISQQNYEYMYVAKGKKPITCQVKNQSEIDIEQYANETSYERIYIFSGVWDDKNAEALNRKYQALNPHICVIKPSALFAVVPETEIYKSAYINTNGHLRCIDEFKLDTMTCVKAFRKVNRNNYLFARNTFKTDGCFICFLDMDFFYSFEFDALILKRHFCEDEKLEAECIQYIKDYIAGL